MHYPRWGRGAVVWALGGAGAPAPRLPSLTGSSLEDDVACSPAPLLLMSPTLARFQESPRVLYQQHEFSESTGDFD